MIIEGWSNTPFTRHCEKCGKATEYNWADDGTDETGKPYTTYECLSCGKVTFEEICED